MSTATAVTREPTPASVWRTVAEGTIDDELLGWPPDVYALTEVLLGRCEAYRFALSPPDGAQWPPADIPGWPEAVVETARQWTAWLEAPTGAIPDLLAEQWNALVEEAGIPMNRLRGPDGWRLSAALLTLHAIADEACAGLGVALDASDCEGLVHRARGRELLARTGSLARIPTHLMRVLPKLRTPANGTSLRSLSRYATVHPPVVEVRWHKVVAQTAGIRPHDNGVHLLLLPWPLRVRESDFRPIDGSVDTLSNEPFGFFEFAPPDGLDFDLLDRVLDAANDEVGRVNVAVLPESAVDHGEIDDLEALLAQHGVSGLVTGVRHRSEHPGQFPGNWVHVGGWTGQHWVHIRQSKHHRWSLDEPQIDQYHLGGALHPHIRWWEAMEVPRRALQIVEIGEGATMGGVREIPLDPGAQGVLISASADRAIRRSSDGRRPVANGSAYFDVSVCQVRASSTGAGRAGGRGASPPQPALEPEDLTVLVSWAEALAEALACAPERLEAVAAGARAGAAWRTALALPEPSPELDQALASIDETVQTAIRADADQRVGAVLLTAQTRQSDESPILRLARRAIRSAIEQRQTRVTRTDVAT